MNLLDANATHFTATRISKRRYAIQLHTKRHAARMHSLRMGMVYPLRGRWIAVDVKNFVGMTPLSTMSPCWPMQDVQRIAETIKRLRSDANEM